jgi:CDP-glycerol glycerophosphotransferase
MPPRLSVVVPFYGVEDYIGDCLESIRIQSFPDIEVIAVDDGSRDGSRAVVDAFAAKDPRFTVVEQENMGLGPARNTGVAHASGEFITFIDSDDLVTVHGFERMIDRLDESGSSFAGGNARRFNNSSGVRQSWSHRNAFAKDRLATHISEQPALARDRMVWNKVYRRSFWDEFAYSFPAIRYEDYPVTLKAHLDAVTVDIMADPVYFWRERESGDSITQQAFRYDNLLDRVVSAELVLALLDHATHRVRSEVLTALAETDLVTINQAFATVPDSEANRLLALGRRLAEQLGRTAIYDTHHYNRIQYQALIAGDVDLLRRLAVYRGEGRLTGRARGKSHPFIPGRVEFPFPGLGEGAIPRRLYAVPRRQVGLRTSVQAAYWDADDLHVSGTAEIRHVPTTTRSHLSVQFGAGGHWVNVPVERFDTVDTHGDVSYVGFSTSIGRAVLEQMSTDPERSGQFRVGLRNGGRFSEDTLKFPSPGSAFWPDGAWVSERVYAQPTTTSKNQFVVTWLHDPARLTEAATADGSYALTIEVPGAPASADLVFARNRTAPELRWPATVDVHDAGATLRFEVPLTAILEGVEHDDPFLQSNARAVLLSIGGQEPETVVWNDGSQSVGAVQGHHLVRLTRSPAARVNLIEGPVRLTASSVRLEGDARSCMVVSGQNWSGRTDWRPHWRRYLPDSDNHVDVAAQVEIDERGWEARIPVSELVAVGTPEQLAARPVVWSLFVAPPEGPATAVVCEPFLNADLPLEFDEGGRRAVVRVDREILHVNVTLAP